jgi:hypothetical protein
MVLDTDAEICRLIADVDRYGAVSGAEENIARLVVLGVFRGQSVARYWKPMRLWILPPVSPHLARPSGCLGSLLTSGAASVSYELTDGQGGSCAAGTGSAAARIDRRGTITCKSVVIRPGGSAASAGSPLPESGAFVHDRSRKGQHLHRPQLSLQLAHGRVAVGSGAAARPRAAVAVAEPDPA